MKRTPKTALVVSPGGMGCTYLINSLAGKITTNKSSDADTLKHCPDPSDERYDGLNPRVVYVWNDPLRSILSHARRGWLRDQCIKLQGNFEAASSLELLWKACLDKGDDVFGLNMHAKNWLRSCRWPLFFLDMRDVNRQKGHLSKFLGISTDHLVLMQRSEYNVDIIPDQVQEIYRRIDIKVIEWSRRYCWSFSNQRDRQAPRLGI